MNKHPHNKKYTLLLGSNMGEKLNYISSALLLIEEYMGAITRKTTIHETEPWGNTDQDTFLNMALIVESELEPLALLQKIHFIEEKLGRRRIEKWGPRTIDIDILYCEDLVMNNETLSIPHPWLHERKFTLDLLVELDQNFIHPVLKKSNRQLLQDLEKKTN